MKMSQNKLLTFIMTAVWVVKKEDIFIFFYSHWSNLNYNMNFYILQLEFEELVLKMND